MRQIFNMQTDPHWLRGVKIGFIVTFLFLLSLLFPIAGPFVIEHLITPLVEIGGMPFTKFGELTKYGTGPIPIWFSFQLPTIIGWVAFVFVGTFIGSLIGAISDKRRGYVTKGLKRVFFFQVVVVLIYVGYFAFIINAMNSNSLKYCEILSGKQKDDCRVRFLGKGPNISISDPEFCHDIKHRDPSDRYDKKNACYSLIAKRSNRPDYCDFIVDQTRNPWGLSKKDECYQQFE